MSNLDTTMNYSKRLAFWEILLLSICFFEIFKRVSVLLPSAYLVIFLLLGFIIVAAKTKTYLLQDRSYFWLFVYFIVVLINFISGDFYFDTLGDVIQEVALLFLPAALFCCIVTGKRIMLAKAIVIMVICVVIYYSIASYLIELVFPGIIRQTVAMSEGGEYQILRSLFTKGLVTYQFPHALPILIPPLIMWLRMGSQTTFQKIFTIISLLAILLLVFISYSGSALFLSLIVLLLSILVKKGDMKKNLIRLIIAFIIATPVLLNIDVILKPLEQLFQTDLTLYFDKLNEVQNLAGGSSTGDIAARENKYSITFAQIIQNPIIGTNNENGGHAAVFDRLACLGLVGWIPYIIFIIAQIRFAYSNIDRNNRVYYCLGMFAALFMLCLKNMSTWETWFMFFTILPLMTWLPSQSKSIDAVS